MPIEAIQDDATLRRESRSLKALFAQIDWLLVLLCTVNIIWQVRVSSSGISGLSVPQDDFYYYAKVAQNLAAGHGSTFNGIVPTNGYHPLYLLVLWLVAWVNPKIAALIRAYEVIVSLGAVAVYAGSRRIAKTFHPGVYLPRLLAFVVALLSWSIMASGLEIILTIPLAICLIAAFLSIARPWNSLQGFLLGLTAALLVLSRLDCGLLIVLLWLVDFFGEKVFCKLSWRVMIAAVAGFFPVFLYLGSNVLWFHALLPMSGVVKDLHVHRGFSSLPFRALLGFDYLQDVTVIAGLASIAILVALWSDLRGFQKSVAMATLVFPLAHLIIISWTSDWPIWVWYMYPWAITAAISLPLIGRFAERRRTARVGFACVLALLSLYLVRTFVGSVRHWHSREPIAFRVQGGAQIAAFAKNHPGIYAMGDRAGVVSEMVQSPIIQTEGLMMDKTFMDHIKRQDDLLSVLRRYKVRYYIASIRPDVRYLPCLDAKEPAQSGNMAPHMRSTICVSPVFASRNQDYTTLIYDLDAVY